jgi:lactate racemase
MDIQLAYGRTGATIAVPDENLVAVVAADWPAVFPHPRKAVAKALHRPVAGPPLSEVIAGCLRECGCSTDSVNHRKARPPRVVILASDTTRPCPNAEILGPILDELHRATVPPECVTILIGTGLHAPVGREAVKVLLGPDIVARCRVVNHFGHRRASLKELGRTAAGTPVALAREWVDADLRIATGVIEPHLMAGFSGGRKAICPGIAGDETVRAFHAPRFIEHPRALPGFLEGNPTHEEALAVAAFAPAHFTVNVTVDRGVRMTGVFGGEMAAVHAAGVAFLREHICRPVREMSDILVTTNGGHPLDATYYQGQKGLLTGLPILRPGGTFLFAAACDEGLGQAEFTDLCSRFRTLDEFQAAITAPGATVVKDQWGLENLAKAARHAEVLFWSDRLAAEDLRRMFVTPVPSLADGLSLALARHGPSARVTVMPDGPYVLPYVSGHLSD